MARPAFAGRRARSRSGQLAAFGAVVLLVATALAGLGGAIVPVLDAGARTVVQHAGPEASALCIQSRLAADAEAQDSAVRDSIATSVRNVSFEVARTAVAEADGLLLLADPGLPDAAELTAGAWPSLPSETVVQDAAAAQLGLAPGDMVTLAGTTVTVTGTWVARDPAASRWFGDPAIGSGGDGDLRGPFLVDESLLAASGTGATARWTLVPADDALSAASLPAVADAIARLDIQLRRTSTGESSATLDGGLAASVARATRVTAVAAGVLGLPLVLVGLAGAIVLGLIARAIASGRGGELVLLRARGASPRALATAAGREAAGVSIAGAGFAAVAAVIVLGTSLVPVLIAAGVAVFATAVAVVMTVLELRAPVAGRADAGRAAVLAAVAPLLLVLVVAGLALAQFLALGSPVVIRVDGVVRTDPLALAAPVLVLLTGALAAPVVAGPVVAVAERIATGGRGILPVLPLRQLARRARTVAAAVLVVALAAGAVVVAAAFQLGATNARIDAERAATGADLRVAVSARPSVDALAPVVSSADIEGLAAVDGAFSVLSSTAGVGPEAIPLVAADAARLAAVDRAPPALAGVAAELSVPRSGVAVPAGTTALTAQFDVTAGDGTPEGLALDVIAWLADRDGAARAVTLGSLPLVAGAAEVTGDIPPAAQLLAFELDAPKLPPTFIEIALDGVHTATGDALAFPAVPALEPVSSKAVRFSAVADDESALPVVVSTALAERLALAVGAEASVRVAAVPVPVTIRVVAISRTLPGLGAGPGILIDLQVLESRAVALGGSVPAANQLWIESAAPDAAAAAIRATLTQRARFTAPATLSPAPVLDPTLLMLLAGTAVTVVLAILGFAAVAAAVAQRRRTELAPLRSLGMPVARIRAARAIELVATALIALLLGGLAGLLTAALVVPGLVGVMT